MVPRSQVRDLGLSVDAALKHIISMGVVAPTVVPMVAPSTVPAAPDRNPNG
jgi:uncharacterized membrane protein